MRFASISGAGTPFCGCSLHLQAAALNAAVCWLGDSAPTAARLTMTHLWSVEGHRRHGGRGGGGATAAQLPRSPSPTATSPGHCRKSRSTAVLVSVYTGFRSVCCTLVRPEILFIDYLYANTVKGHNEKNRGKSFNIIFIIGYVSFND